MEGKVLLLFIIVIIVLPCTNSREQNERNETATVDGDGMKDG